MSQATLTSETSDKNVLTYSALNTFRNCPRKYKHRYVDNLRPRMKVESLSFGSVIHRAIEIWYRSIDDATRLWIVLRFHRSQLSRTSNRREPASKLASSSRHHDWLRLALCNRGLYDHRDRKSFTGNNRNPDTGRCSQTFVMAGKADAIVQRSDGMYLLEHKTAASIDSNYLDKLGPIRRSRCTATNCVNWLPDRRRDLQRAAQEPPQAKQRRDARRVRSTPR